MKSGYASVNYLKKEDSTPIAFGTIPEPCMSTLPKQRENGTAGRQKKLTDTIAQSLQSGSTPADILKQHPGFYLLNKQKVDSLYSMLLQESRKPLLKTWPRNLSYQGTNSSTYKDEALLNGVYRSMINAGIGNVSDFKYKGSDFTSMYKADGTVQLTNKQTKQTDLYIPQYDKSNKFIGLKKK